MGSKSDDKPLTSADRKFFGLRESGWKGAVNQDGDAVMDRTDDKGNPLPLLRKGR